MQPLRTHCCTACSRPQWDSVTGANFQTVMMTPRTTVRCMAVEGRSGSTGPSLTAARTRTSTHTHVHVKVRVVVVLMLRAAGAAVFCGHSDGRVSELQVPDPPSHDLVEGAPARQYPEASAACPRPLFCSVSSADPM